MLQEYWKELIVQSYRQTNQSEMLELIKIIDFENAISWKSHTVIDLIASKPVIVSYNSDESIWKRILTQSYHFIIVLRMKEPSKKRQFNDLHYGSKLQLWFNVNRVIGMFPYILN